MILLARAIQGAGGGALQPLSQAILLESFPPAKRGVAMALFGLGVVVAPVLGPTLGGWLTDQYSWRWAFYINIPIGVIAVFMISRFVKDPPYIAKANAGRIDSIGLGLLAIWLACLQIILDKGQEDDWFGADVDPLGLCDSHRRVRRLPIVRELTAEKTARRLEVFKNRNFALGCMLIGLFGAVIYGLVTILPLFYQTVMGYTASAAGIAVSPRGLGAIAMMPVVGILTSKIDNRWLSPPDSRLRVVRVLDGAPHALDFAVVAYLAHRPQRRRRRLRLRSALDHRHGHAQQRADRQRQRPLQSAPQHRRQHRHLRRQYYRHASPSKRIAPTFRATSRPRIAFSQIWLAVTAPLVPRRAQHLPSSRPSRRRQWPRHSSHRLLLR